MFEEEENPKNKVNPESTVVDYYFHDAHFLTGLFLCRVKTNNGCYRNRKIWAGRIKKEKDRKRKSAKGKVRKWK